MRPVYLFLLLCLVCFSCQQRYGHVKKIRREAVEMVQKQEDLLSVPREALIPTDSATVLIPISEQPTETALVDEELPAEEELRQTDHPKKEWMPSFEQVVKQVPAFIPLVHDSRNGDIPKDQLLMIAVFIFWIGIYSFIVSAILVVGIFIVLSAFFFGGVAVPIEILLSIIFVSLIFLILAFVLAFFTGRKRIEEHLGYLPPHKELIRNYFIAFGITIGLNLISSILPIVGLFLPLALIVAAGIYTLTWDD